MCINVMRPFGLLVIAHTSGFSLTICLGTSVDQFRSASEREKRKKRRPRAIIISESRCPMWYLYNGKNAQKSSQE